MLTNSDINKLKGIFATKNDLLGAATKDDLKRFATKEDLKRFATKEDLKKLEEVSASKNDLKDLKHEFISRFDEVMSELKAIREELTVGTYRRYENSITLDNHEDRITTVEKKLSF